MYRHMVRCAPCLIVLLALACQQKVDENALVKLGSQVLTKEDYGYFSSMARYFPLKNPQVFPGHRKTVTTLLETELLYRKAPGSFKSSSERQTTDWQWRKRYYHGQLYIMSILVRNLGFTDEQITQYYDANREDSFKTIIKVAVDQPEDSAASDSARIDSVVAREPQTRDSVAYRPMSEVRDRIVKQLFIETYPPDSGYIARFFGDDSISDSSKVYEQWFQFMSRQIRTRDQDFFLRRYYEDVHGHELPDSMSAWLGEGKPVKPEDVDILMSWLPERDRERYNTERGRTELARWALRYKTYAQKAKEIGFTESKEVQKNLEWAWKFHVVNEYLDQELLPQLREGIAIDTAVAKFSYWDSRRKVEIPPDSTGIAREVESQENRLLALRLDSAIYDLRTDRGVTFLQNDYRDAKEHPPESLLHRADSLRDTGNTSEAEKVYRDLTNNYAFTDEGGEAFAELAKLLTEKQRYPDAIRNYRLHLYHTDDSAAMCNTYFMIGFIYDEYENKPELAEVNYKWVLKNTPQCELADDAEFMMLHLDEPMIRIEDLRAEAIRQGRDVGDDDEELDPVTVDDAEQASPE
ncbi:MAG: hypothetical protein GF331_21655 [Chitinivibrionales bacterium]|nr:hypothetical protein [Chitinivibrionales bacterium]